MKKINSTLIIILNWNELKLTLRCVESLKSQLGSCEHILLVDNHSKDNPTYFIKQCYPHINIIRTKKNLGVAGGRNIGIQYALEFRYKYILFIDNDAYADSKLIQKLLSAAENYPDTALFGPKIYYENSNQVIWRAGCTSWKWTYLHAGFVILNRFCHLLRKRPPAWIDTGRGENQTDCGQFDKTEEIDFQIGCAQFIRTTVFRKIGLLDMDFCPYGSEDIDFCARLKKHGWKIKYIPDAICWHRSESSFSNSYNRSFYNMRNILIIARKHLNPFYFSFLFFPDFILITIPLIIIEGIFLRQNKKLRGVIEAIKWTFKDIKKRGLFLKPIKP